MLIAVFVFVIGTCAGSFCSALLHRTRFGGSVVTGRSECVKCRHRLGFFDLIPIFSWLVRRGRCRYCRAPFGCQYLILEIVFGLLFLGAYWRFLPKEGVCLAAGCWADFARLAVFFVFLALVFVYDARYGEIPDSFSITGAVCAYVINVFANPSAWFWYLLAAAVGAAFFGAQYVVSRGKWIGDGDIILGIMIGAMVGWPFVIPAIFLAYILGLGVVIALVLSRRKQMSDTMPLGPLLALGTAIILTVPPQYFLRYFYAFA
jgi:prepilin signal peptidase PulO-like enzyme (type II secretory pathway)